MQLETIILIASILAIIILFVALVITARNWACKKEYENRPYLQRSYSFKDWKRLFW